MGIRISPVFISSIPIVWPLVQEGLDAIDRKAGSDGDLEQVRAGLEKGILQLFFVYDGKEYIGFFIVKIDQGPNGLELCIYKGYKIPECRHLEKDLFLQLKTVSKQYNCTTITFYSRRKGWERQAMRYGFRKGYTQYTMEVE